MDLKGKPVWDLVRLGSELSAAGVTHRGLGVAGDVLHTYDAAGRAIDLALAAQAVLDAHVAGSVPNPRALARAALQSATSLDQVKSALVGYLGSLT